MLFRKNNVHEEDETYREYHSDITISCWCTSEMLTPSLDIWYHDKEKTLVDYVDHIYLQWYTAAVPGVWHNFVHACTVFWRIIRGKRYSQQAIGMTPDEAQALAEYLNQYARISRYVKDIQKVQKEDGTLDYYLSMRKKRRKTDDNLPGD